MLLTTGTSAFFIFFEVLFAVFLLEPFYPSRGVDEFLLACIERMAHRADFSVYFFRCAARLERASTAATNHYLLVFWMYIFFHKSAPKT
jgi:hypothetical protein